jgi:Uroporphyrinogen decarboxylase (URO-D)
VKDIQKNKDFLRRLWQLENSERPAFMLGYVGPKVKGGEPVKSALFSTEGKDTVKNRLLDPKNYLAAQLQEINSMLVLPGDYVPSLCPSLGVIAVASGFGSEVIWWENDFPAVKPLLGDEPHQVYDLKRPTTTDGELGRILDYTRYFISQTKGALPIRLTDIQGPLDNASLIMGHNQLMMAMLSHPGEVHHLMRLVTDCMITLIKAQREIVRNAGVEFVPAIFQPWLPDEAGISISNDDWVMISSEMHDEFHLPYLNELSEEFGGIYLHSCGNWFHHLPSLKKIVKLRGIEFGASEVPYQAVMETLGGKIVLACRVGFNRENTFSSMADYVQKILQAAKTNCGLFLNIDVTNGVLSENWPETDLDQIFHLLGIS